MLVLILFLAMPTTPTVSAEQDMPVTEMDDVTFTCSSIGEPAVMYEWSYTNTSGIGFLNITTLFVNYFYFV